MTAERQPAQTGREREESALRYSEENYRLVVETAPDAVISIDERGAILFANPATVRIFGYDPTELIGKPLTILMPEFLRKLHEKGFSRYLATGQRHINWQGTELTALRKNGQEFPVEISFGELSRDGHKVFTGFIRDISERKQAQQALQMTQYRDHRSAQSPRALETTRLSICMPSLMRPGTRMVSWSTSRRCRMSRRAGWPKRHATRLDRHLAGPKRRGESVPNRWGVVAGRVGLGTVHVGATHPRVAE
jgi:PAS domain S-box-containing protein